MALTHLSDFPDRLSPMLVKELRQGLRAKTFIAVFLSLQIFLGLMLLSAGAAATSARAGSVVSAIIFAFFSIAVLIVQPLRGVAALSSEVKGNTIDMMVLTRLGASRIVYGKWVGIVSQSALLLATIIPYLILRYFFGGMNFLAEMVLLALIFLTSMALTAVTVGLSGCSSILIRGILPLLGTPVLLFSLAAMTFGNGIGEVIEIASLDSTESRIVVPCYIATLAWLGWLAMSLGASLIAPAAENHSTLRRLIAIGAVIVTIPFIALDQIDSNLIPLLLGVILGPILIVSLTESSALVPTVCRPFVKRGFIGKLVGYFLYPGWASGVFFTAMILLLAGLAATLHPGSHNEEVWIVTLSLIGAILFPAVLVNLFVKGEGQRVATYLLLLIGSGILSGILAAILGSMDNEEILWLFIWSPLVFLSMMEMTGFGNDHLLVAVIAVNTVYILILIGRAIIAFRGYREIIAQAEDESMDIPLPSKS